MVPGKGEHRDRAIHPIRALVPVTPFPIAIFVIDQVAGVQGKSSARRIAKGFAKDPGPVRSHVILRIAEVDEAERPRPIARGFEVVVLGPVDAVSDPVRIQRVRLEIPDRRAVIMGFIDIAGERFRRRGNLPGLHRPSVTAGERHLNQALLHGDIRTPGHGLGGGGIVCPGEHHTIRQRRRGMRVRRREGCRLPIGLRTRRTGQGEAQRERCENETTHATLLLLAPDRWRVESRVDAECAPRRQFLGTGPGPGRA